MPSKKSAWTEADYEAAGKVRVNLRLDKDAAETLNEVAHISGQTRQALMEELLRQVRAGKIVIPKAEIEQPERTPADYVDPPKKRKARKA